MNTIKVIDKFNNSEVEIQNTNEKKQKKIIIKNGWDLTMKPKRWLWKNWLAQGKLHILGGAPGNGKTTIAMEVASTLASEKNWPDKSKCPTGDVLIWSGEDCPDDTLGPKLILAGADRDKFHFITSTEEQRKKRCFDPSKDIYDLKRSLRSMPNIKLIIIDPIVSASIGDGHKNVEVRRSLQPIVDMAEQTDCAVLGITHFSKGTGGRDPVERLSGSIAFGALARVVWVAAKGKDNDDNEKRILCIAKSNIGIDQAGFEYTIVNKPLEDVVGVEATKIQWEKQIYGDARENLENIEFKQDGALQDAMNFLISVLEDGPISSKQLKADSLGANHSDKTIQRAGDELRKKGYRINRYKESKSWFVSLEKFSITNEVGQHGQ